MPANPAPAPASRPRPHLQCCRRWCRASYFDAANDVQSWVEQFFFFFFYISFVSLSLECLSFHISISGISELCPFFFQATTLSWLCVWVFYSCVSKLKLTKIGQKMLSGCVPPLSLSLSLALLLSLFHRLSLSSNKFCINEIANTM